MESVIIQKVIGEGKRFMAYQIVKILKGQNNFKILQEMTNGVTSSELKNNVIHKVFEDSFDCKECYSSEFIQQKLQYIHNNPIKDKWKLANLPEEYLHSSAKYYFTGEKGIYPVTHYLEFYDIPLAK
ncbi:MAG: hypothetical protein KA954_11380 [Chitinophagales bacterium]|nr:hypothetical protein [Bacteroidota bacterium]MBK8681035.1 hypothetical protein [Bacteroidota bacterium]MBP7400182.1 hypothetical protein [Chitinophagales bacterium]MBP9190769.1 hypothetical protein [Chitinophagales bacterium]MBP9704076.1 hypothetical protein [Chitinophagales bacterium]